LNVERETLLMLSLTLNPQVLRGLAYLREKHQIMHRGRSIP